MSVLKEPDSLQEIQAYFKKVLAERGFGDEVVAEKMVLLAEEVGELARAIRKSHTSLKSSVETSSADAADEAADIFVVLMDICNKLGIDLFEAIKVKEAKNSKRVWK